MIEDKKLLEATRQTDINNLPEATPGFYADHFGTKELTGYLGQLINGDEEGRAKEFVRHIKDMNGKDYHWARLGQKYSPDKTVVALYDENYKPIAIMNKPGLSAQDGWDTVRTVGQTAPLLIPGVGEGGALARGLVEGAEKLLPKVAEKAIAKKLVSNVPLAGVSAVEEGAVDVGSKYDAGEKIDKLDTLKNAGKTALMTPLFVMGGDKILKGIGKTSKYAGNKLSGAFKPAENKTLESNLNLNAGDIPLTHGQATGDKNSLAYEDRAREGLEGKKPQELANRFRYVQNQQVANRLKNDFGVEAGNQDLVNNFTSHLQKDMRGAMEKSNQNVQEAYSKIPMDDFGLKKEAGDELIQELASTLPKNTDNLIFSHGKEADPFKAFNFIKNLQSSLNHITSKGVEKESDKNMINLISDYIPFIDSQKEDFENAIIKKGNRNFDFIPQSILEDNRRVLNSAIEDAVKKEDNNSLQHLMAVKNKYDDTIDRYLKSPAYSVGDTQHIDSLFNARALKKEHEDNFTNTSHRLYNKSSLDQGARKFVEYINNPDKTAQNISKDIFSTTANPDVQLGFINRVRKVFGNKHDADLKKAFLQPIFTDIDKKGGAGSLSLADTLNNNSVVKVIERIEKNPKVANVLFNEEEKQAIEKMKNILDKVQQSHKQLNPSGTGHILARYALNSVPLKFDLLKIFDSTFGSLIKHIKADKYYSKMYKASGDRILERIGANNNKKIRVKTAPSKTGRAVGMMLEKERENDN